MSSCPFYTVTSPHPQSTAAIDLISVPYNFDFSKLSYKWNYAYYGFFHLAWWIWDSCLSLHLSVDCSSGFLSSIPLYVFNSLFFHLIVDRHLAYFHFWNVKNKPLIFTHMFLCGHTILFLLSKGLVQNCWVVCSVYV